jgi:hypothetical protein
MIYTIFLYQSKTGLLIYDISFQEVSAGSTEMFSSFLTAMKAFVSELILDGSKELKNIELGDYSVLITSISKVQVDLVIISDKEDIKSVNKITPKLIKLLLKYEELFQTWDGDREEFQILDHPLTQLVKENVKDVRKSLIESDEMFKSIIGYRKQISDSNRENLIQERDLLIYKYEKLTNLLKKLGIGKKIISVSQKLKDEDIALKFEDEIKRLNNEIKDTEFKLNYYLKKIITTLNEALEKLGDKPLHSGDFKDTYLNLYSFSTKLKLMIDRGWEKYRELASKIIDKDSLSDDELSEIIKAILKMSPNIKDYLS